MVTLHVPVANTEDVSLMHIWILHKGRTTEEEQGQCTHRIWLWFEVALRHYRRLCVTLL